MRCQDMCLCPAAWRCVLRVGFEQFARVLVVLFERCLGWMNFLLMSNNVVRQHYFHALMGPAIHRHHTLPKLVTLIIY